MQKKNRLKKMLAVILAFAMLLTGVIPGNITAMQNVKAAEEQKQIEDGTVYFQYSNGDIQYMDETNTFTLKTTDQGYFKVAGVSGAEWECSSKVYEQTPDNTTSERNHYWIKYSTGKFDGTPGAKELSAYVIAGGKRTDFKLKVVEDSYVELKAYINDTELTTDTPYYVNGADVNVSVTFKARKEGETAFSVISPDLLKVQEENANYGRYNRVNKTFAVLRDDGTAGFTVSLKSNAKVQVSFSLKAKEVKIQDFHVNIPSEWAIDAWNELAGQQYVGIIYGNDSSKNYNVSFTPYNTSNKDLKWDNLTPDIAEYSDETFSNGIVPKKAGLAKFMVSSVQNPEIKHEVQVNFKYKYPLTEASIEKGTFNVRLGEAQPLEIKTIPANATEQRFNWTYSEDGIVKVTESVSSSTSDATAPKATSHTLRALKEGTVTVTGTPIDDTAGCKSVVFTVNVTKSGTVVNPIDMDKIVTEGIKSAIGYLNETQTTYKYDNEWSVIAKYRTGQTLDKKTLNAYYNSVAEEVAKWKADEAKNPKKARKPTDIARVALALSAIGADITNVKGMNLAEMMYNSPRLAEGSNELIWCLLALDATNIEIPDNATWSREKMVDALLTFQNENGCFGLYDNAPDSLPDLTGMALQALAPYKNQEKVQTSINKSLEYLKDNLSADYGYSTPETCSQVILGLAALKLDPIEKGFGTEEKNIISYLKDTYMVAEGGFSHFKKGEEYYGVNYIATYQALEALEGYRRCAANEKAFWDMSDVEKFVPGDTDTKPATDSKPGTTTTTQKKAQTQVSKPGRVTLKKVKRSGKKIKLQWKKVKGCSGYQIWISSKKNGKYKLAKTRKGANAAAYTLKQNKKKKVYIKVRAYKAVGKTKVYGKYSKVKTVK